MNIGAKLGRGRLLLIVPIALLCLAVPLWMMGKPGNAGLLDDTSAFFGAGSTDDVPRVSQVRCISSRIGSSSSTSRSVGMTEWDCSLYLSSAAPPPTDDPFKTLPYDQAMAEWSRRTNAELKRVTDPANRMSAKIDRILASNRTDDIPTLRRLSAPGERPRFGVVWSGWEIASRWLRWALLTSLFWGIGIVLLYASRSIWARRI